MKKIIALSPKLYQPSDLAAFSHCLDFLKTDNHITWIDSLAGFNHYTFEKYSEYWKHKIISWLDAYDVFMGFSLGGILLQNHLAQFERKDKTIILFSPPSIIDENLKEKLTTVLNASLSGKTNEAIEMLNHYVHANTDDFEKTRTETWDVIAKRLQFGLHYVLNNALPEKTKNSSAAVYQLVGATSQLVTKDNIFMTPNSNCQMVPNAGNRVLEDNPIFCQSLIKEWLYGKK